MKEYSLLKDIRFEQGLQVRAEGIPIYKDERNTPEWFDNRSTDTKLIFTYEGKGYKTDLSVLPPWRLAQWASRYSFTDTNNTVTETDFDGKQSYSYRFYKDGDAAVYDNTSKTVTVNPVKGEITLSLRAGKCYKKIREDGQEWPHLLIEQDIAGVSQVKANDKFSIGKSKAVKMRLNMRLNGFNDAKMPKPVDCTRYASICMFYVYVAYLPDGKDEFAQHLCMGMPVFDNRWIKGSEQPVSENTFNKVMNQKDGGKESAEGYWIYNVEASSFLEKEDNIYTSDFTKMVFGKWVKIDYDILPRIKTALKESQKAGYMPKDAKLENLYISRMYVGFENTGIYDTDMTFSGVDIVNCL